jgi:chromosome segregation ATPase
MSGKPDVPTDDGPFGGDGGFLDDLRAGGEQAVNDELAGLQEAMSRVKGFTANLADSDIAALRAEWQSIESELKRALQSGLSAVEEKGSARRQASVSDDLAALSAEVSRKNELIAQLTDTVKRLNTETDEKERRLRDDLRSARERAASAEDELGALRARSLDGEQARGKARSDLEAASAEREALKVSLGQASEALEVERAHQEERHAELQKELNDVRLTNARLENEKRDAERKAADLDKRSVAAERAREKADQDRSDKTKEAARLAKEVEALADRAAELERELTLQRDRIDRDLRRAQRQASRFQADSATSRSRVADALTGLRAALATLENLPPEAPADDEPTPGSQDAPA